MPSTISFDLTMSSSVACVLQGFPEDSLKWWDVSFWSERLREAKYAINEEELRPYFSLPQVRVCAFAKGRVSGCVHATQTSAC